MKYSFMTFSTPDQPLDGVLTAAVSNGYDGIEPRISASHAHGIELSLTAAERAAVRRDCAAAGVEIACIATSLRFAVDSPEHSAGATVEEALAAIDLAADLGCPCLRIFGGVFGDENLREAATETAVAGLLRVAPAAAAARVNLALETHDQWCRPSDIARIMTEVRARAADPTAARRIGVNWDFMHTQRVGGYTTAQSYEALRPWIMHVHVHDGTELVNADGSRSIRIKPMGTGVYDHRAAVGLLAKDHYAGYLSGEWIDSMLGGVYPAAEHLRNEIAVLRRWESETTA